MGDDQGGSQIDLAIQTSSPGFSIGDYPHPCWEYVSVLKREGVSWIDEQSENQEKKICAGDLMSFPPNVLHRFRTTGRVALKKYGIHVLSQFFIINI